MTTTEQSEEPAMTREELKTGTAAHPIGSPTWSAAALARIAELETRPAEPVRVEVVCSAGPIKLPIRWPKEAFDALEAGRPVLLVPANPEGRS